MVQWLGLCSSTAGSTPTQGTESSRAAPKSQASRQRNKQSIPITKCRCFSKSQPNGVVRTSAILPSTENLPNVLEYRERRQKEPFLTSSQNILVLRLLQQSNDSMAEWQSEHIWLEYIRAPKLLQNTTRFWKAEQTPNSLGFPYEVYHSIYVCNWYFPNFPFITWKKVSWVKLATLNHTANVCWG